MPISAPTRTRTWNQLLKRQLLFQLSYGGKTQGVVDSQVMSYQCKRGLPPAGSIIPLFIKRLLIIIQAPKITAKPMATAVTIDLACFKASGLTPPNKNITPPITSIIPATGGININIINLITLLSIRNK